MFSLWGAKRPLVEDRLNLEAVTDEDGWLHGCGGLPSASDSCAYEPIQKLLAVGTWDGRVKVFGKQGVECTIYSACHYAYSTRQLDFLTNRGILVRLSEGGFLEAWCLSGGQDVRSSKRDLGGVIDLCSIKIENDYLACFTSMRTEPFMLMGTGNGNLRFAALVGPQGGVVPALKQATNMRLLPYQVTAEEMRASGELHQLAVRSIGSQHIVLVLHFTSGLTLWDLRAQSITAQINPFSKESPNPVLRKAGRITAAAWLTPTVESVAKGSDRADFITGHNAGDILIWRLPSLSEAPGPPEIQCQRRVVPSSAEPVKSLTGVTVCRRQAVVVMGGWPEEQLDGLAVMAISEKPELATQHTNNQSSYDVDEEQEADSEDGDTGRGASGGTLATGATCMHLTREALPLGYFTLPVSGSIPGFQDIDAVVQFQEGPQLSVQLVAGRQAVPGKVQSLPGLQGHDGEITCTAAYIIPYVRTGSQPVHMLTVSAFLQAQPPGGGGVTWQEELGRGIAGGTPPKPDASQCLVYVTGYKNGFVDIWHVSGEQPQLLSSAPSPSVVGAKLGRSSLKGVTALDLSTQHGIMCTGHAKGEVRVYQFTPKPRPVNIVTLKADKAAELKSVQVFEDPGMQLRLRSVANEGEITAVSCAPSGTTIVAADKTGCVSVIDMTQPALLWCLTPVAQPCTDVLITTMAAPPKKDRAPGTLGAEVKDGAPVPVILLVCADSCVAVLHLETGNFIGKNGELKPKSRSWALFCEPLDDMYRPVWSTGGGSRGLPGKAAQKPVVGSWRKKLHGGGKGVREFASDTESGYTSTEEDEGEEDSENEDLAGVGVVSGPAPQASHLLLVSTEHIRVYTMHGVLVGDRTTLTKVCPPYPLIWAATFMAGSAPGLVALAQPADGSDPVFMVGQPPVQWLCPPGSTKARRTIAATRQGHLMLLAEGKELLQLHITPALPSIVTPTCLYDPDIAAAAHSAAAAHERNLLAAMSAAERRPPAGRLNSAVTATSMGSGLTSAGPSGPAAPYSLTGGSDEDEVEAELEAAARRGPGGTVLAGVLNKVTQGMTKVFEDTGKGLATMAKGVEEGVKGGIKGVGRLLWDEDEDAMSSYNSQLPSLLWVLGQSGAPERTKSKRGKKQEEDDGIPITNPHAIVLPSNLSGPPPPWPPPPVRAPPPTDLDVPAVSRSPHTPGSASARLETPSAKTFSLPTTKSERVHHTNSGDADGDEHHAAGAGTAKWKRKALLAAAFSKHSSKESKEPGAGSTSRKGEQSRQPDDDVEYEDYEGRSQFTRRAPPKINTSSHAAGDDSSDYEDYTHNAPAPKKQGSQQARAGDSEGRDGSGGGAGAGEMMAAGASKLLGGASALVGKMGKKLGEAGSSSSAAGKGEELSEDAARKKRMSEIYAKYQRGARNGKEQGTGASAINAKASTIRDVVLEARSKLAERGEKLSKMEADSEAMENEAAGFADLAKQVLEQQKNRKWWQL